MSDEGSSVLRDAANRIRPFPPLPGPPAALQAPTPAGATATAAAPTALQSFSTDDAPAGLMSELAVVAAPAVAAGAAPAAAAVTGSPTPTALVLHGAEGAEVAGVVSGAGVAGGAGAAPCTQLLPSAVLSAEHDAISLARAAAALDAPPADASSIKEASRHDHAGAAGAAGEAGAAGVVGAAGALGVHSTAAVWQWVPMATAVAPKPPPAAVLAAAAAADASSVVSAVAALQALQAGSPHPQHHGPSLLARACAAAASTTSGKAEMSHLGPLGGAPRPKRAPDAFSQFNLILRRGLALSTSHHARSVAELRPMLCSELHSLLVRWQQRTDVEEWAHLQAAAGVVPPAPPASTPPESAPPASAPAVSAPTVSAPAGLAITISPVLVAGVAATTSLGFVAATEAETNEAACGAAFAKRRTQSLGESRSLRQYPQPLLLPQPELLAAMATVRDGLAVRSTAKPRAPVPLLSHPNPRTSASTSTPRS